MSLKLALTTIKKIHLSQTDVEIAEDDWKAPQSSSLVNNLLPL